MAISYNQLMRDSGNWQWMIAAQDGSWVTGATQHKCAFEIGDFQQLVESQLAEHDDLLEHSLGSRTRHISVQGLFV